MNDFQNSLSTNLIVNYVKIGVLPGKADNQATFMNKDQLLPTATPAEQIKNIVQCKT